jgi:hypothetical protein
LQLDACLHFPIHPELFHTQLVALPGCREDPTRELSFTEARRALVGDVNLLRRIWKFLASWQLINFLARRQSGAAAETAAAGAGKGTSGWPGSAVGRRRGGEERARLCRGQRCALQLALLALPGLLVPHWRLI